MMSSFLKIAVACVLFTAMTATAMGYKNREGRDQDKAQNQIKETYDEAKNETKEVYRDIKDETCEMIHGKMECAPQKIKHKAKNMKDDLEDGVKDIKR